MLQKRLDNGPFSVNATGFKLNGSYYLIFKCFSNSLAKYKTKWLRNILHHLSIPA